MTAKGDPKGDPVTTVMSKLPAGKGDIGAFLVSYGPAYIAVDALAASIGLPPPITTATLASGAVVGAKNVIQALLAEPQATQPPGTQPPQSKKNLGGENQRIRVAVKRRFAGGVRTLGYREGNSPTLVKSKEILAEEHR